MSKKVRTSLLLDPQIKAEVKQLAEEEKRTLNNMIEKILSDYLSNRK